MNKKLSEEEIDNIVMSQADNDSEWGEPVHVRKTKSTSLSIPAELAARAAFLAHLHRESGVEEWLMRIIRERVDLEEGAFIEAKRELTMTERTQQETEIGAAPEAAPLANVAGN